MKKKLATSTISLFLLNLTASPINAQCPPPQSGQTSICDIYPPAMKGWNLGQYLTPLIRASIIGAGVITMLLIIGGGLGMIANAGNPQAQEKGKNAVTAGVTGLILVFSAYWIVQLMSLLTGKNLLNFGL